jgi:hypothetical protein
MDSFGAAVGNDVNLDNVQKFQYLRAQLTGEAARTIVGLSLTSENYNNAMELLKERYGQKHKIVAAYMKALWGLPSPTGNCRNLSGLRNFYDALESYVHGLNALGKYKNSYGDLIVPIVLEILPLHTKSDSKINISALVVPKISAPLKNLVNLRLPTSRDLTLRIRSQIPIPLR